MAGGGTKVTSNPSHSRILCLIPAGFRWAGVHPSFVGSENFKGISLCSIATFYSTWDNLHILPFSTNCSLQRSNSTMFLLTPFYTLKRISLSPDSPSRVENILSSTRSCYFPSPLKIFILLISLLCSTCRLFLTILDPPCLA